MWLAQRGVTITLTMTVFAIVGQARSGAGAPERPPADRSLVHVFHHICEFSRLAAVLRVHELTGADAEKTWKQAVCAVGDFAFRGGEIHFELYPAAGADDLWLADESYRLKSGVMPAILLRLHRTERTLFVDVLGLGTWRVPREEGEEDRLVIRLSAGRLVLLDERHGMRPILVEPLDFVHGLQLLIPCDGQSCGPEECGLPALDLFLDASDAARWTAAGFSNVDRASY